MLDRHGERHVTSLRRTALEERRLAGTSSCCSCSLSARPAPGDSHRRNIVDLDHIHKWDDSRGDTWDPFWADDDNLYAFNCDGRGLRHGRLRRNLAFNESRGDGPQRAHGPLVNNMDYGKGRPEGTRRGHWKALGQECIDGAFYAFVSRQTYAFDSGTRSCVKRPPTPA